MAELTIKTGIIDYIGEVNGGVSISVSLTIDTYSFQGVYWIHPDKYHTLEVEANFLKLFGSKKIEDLPFLEELVEDIKNILPEREEIFKEFLKK